MSDTTQATNFNSTIHLLQQDLASADLAVAIALIERWEEQLVDTAIFVKLSELKQAILNGDNTTMAKLLSDLGEKTLALAGSVDNESSEVSMQVRQIGALLSHKGNAATEAS